ncbi:head-tail connector protein [Amaricoccus macauensis]|uniref:head-tail connector protein n=1 Tax=Amaricoccus macauensis TaxID=57001 RepID=UPI003C79F5E3
MILTEVGTLASDAIPVRAFAQHLRLGTGFEDDGSEDAVLDLYLRAAISAIEARLGYALLSRQFSWTVTRWKQETSQGLPVGPVESVDEIVLIAADGREEIVDPAKCHLLKDARRPRLIGLDGGALPSIPRSGHAEIRFTAGHGDTWDSVPRDLQQAVFLLAAYYYETRYEASVARETMPFGVLVLIESYRSFKLGGNS